MGSVSGKLNLKHLRDGQGDMSSGQMVYRFDIQERSLKEGSRANLTRGNEVMAQLPKVREWIGRGIQWLMLPECILCVLNTVCLTPLNNHCQRRLLLCLFYK